ncbi:D-Ala-D-Ala carboxypeptidase family metallohydrolase [Maricaulis sp. CAU 1757]
MLLIWTRAVFGLLLTAGLGMFVLVGTVFFPAGGGTAAEASALVAAEPEPTALASVLETAADNREQTEADPVDVMPDAGTAAPPELVPEPTPSLADLAEADVVPRPAPERPAPRAPLRSGNGETASVSAFQAPRPNRTRAGFRLVLPDGLETDLALFTLFARPGEAMVLAASRAVSWQDEAGRILARGTRHTLQADAQPGIQRVSLVADGADRIDVNIVIMEPLSAQSTVREDGYVLGRYPAEPFQGRSNYRAPTHAVGVSEELASLPVSPNFTLGQFLCKQDGPGQPIIVLSPRLLAKLETILEAANARGWRADTLTVMSGYRTPAYNASLGNGANSRHIYGGAADIFIDHDGDGQMDDLNGDGVVDRADAAALYDLVETLTAGPQLAALEGGLGEYDANAYHGPFVHVDERGYRARWGRPRQG